MATEKKCQLNARSDLSSRSPYPPNDGCLDFSGAEVVVSAGRALRNAQLRMNQPGETVNLVVQDNMEAAMRARTQSPTAPAKDASPKKRQPGVDSCWHVAVLAGLVAFIVTTSHAASGFFYVGFMDEFGVDREAASWPSNAITALSHLSGILLAVLQGRVTLFQIFFVGGVLVWFGILASVFVPNMAWMTVTFGVINGLGLGLTIITMGVLLTMYFDRYRGVASGIKFAGTSGSGLAFPKFLSYLQQKYGFRGMLLVYGGIATHVTAFGLLLKEPPWICLKTRGKKEAKPAVQGTTGLQCGLPNAEQRFGCPTSSKIGHCRNLSPLLVLLRQPTFYVVVLCATIADLTSPTFSSTLVDYGVDKGLSLSDAESLIVYGSCTEIAGRLFLPLLADAGWIRRSTLVMISFFVAGCSMILMPHAILRTHVLLVCMCVYIFLGCLTTMKTVLMADYLGIEWISTCHGISGLLLLPLTFITPSIIGLFRDDGGSYDNLYRMYGGILLLLSGIFLLLVCAERSLNDVWTPGQKAQEGGQRNGPISLSAVRMTPPQL